MRIAFNTFASVWPVVCEPQTKASVRAAHVLRNTQRIQRGQAGRQARRAAAGFNKSPEPTAVGAVSSDVAVRVASRRWVSYVRRLRPYPL
jgi:hypothetical protein